MPNVVKAVVDPYLVLLPNPCNSLDPLEKFAEGILAWADAMNREDIQIFISETTIQALLDEGHYPHGYQLSDLVQRFSLEEEVPFDQGTLRDLLRDLLERTPYLEEHLGISEILCEDDSITVNPDIFMSRLSSELGKAFQQSLTILSVSKERLLNIDGNDWVLATSKRKDCEAYRELIVTATIDFVLPYEDNDDISYCSLPIDLEDAFQIYFNYSEVLHKSGCLELWNGGTSEIGAIDAIKLRLDELKQQGSIFHDEALPPFTLGAKFLESVREWGFHDSTLAMNLIDSCARIVANMPSKTRIPFRVGKKTSDPQKIRERDNALAWRNHLTKKGAAYRLMYWQKPSKEIEFANVGSKNELIIYE